MPDGHTYVLSERRIGETRAITHTYATTRSTTEPSWRDLLVISFAGEYGIGAAGNPDAEHMSAVVRLGRELFTPGGIVLDLRDLDYRWGDLIDFALSAATVDGVHPAVVVSERCREGLTSLVIQELEEDPADWLFDTMDDALRVVDAGCRLVRDADAAALPAGTAAARRRMWPSDAGDRGRSERFRHAIWRRREVQPGDDHAAARRTARRARPTGRRCR